MVVRTEVVVDEQGSLQEDAARTREAMERGVVAMVKRRVAAVTR